MTIFVDGKKWKIDVDSRGYIVGMIGDGDGILSLGLRDQFGNPHWRVSDDQLFWDPYAPTAAQQEEVRKEWVRFHIREEYSEMDEFKLHRERIEDPNNAEWRAYQSSIMRTREESRQHFGEVSSWQAPDPPPGYTQPISFEVHEAPVSLQTDPASQIQTSEEPSTTEQ